jgi:uracil-DNA glycosylase
MAGIRPEQVTWREPGGQESLFEGSTAVPAPPAGARQPHVSQRFLDLAQKAALHSDPNRFDLLYRLLWRSQEYPRLFEDAADPDTHRMSDLARGVRRDIHKMRAFVRFREVADPDGNSLYVAWFEPEHHILRANAAFFVNRFTQMRWTILTPRGRLDWDGATLREGPPARREDAPPDDDVEELWRGYYASIFNPARLKVGAMLREMPRKYWKNLPEAALIPDLIAGARAREVAMIERGAAHFDIERPGSLKAIAEEIQACRRCPIGCNGTSAVAGEGPRRAALMVVGEQPGDTEEVEGRPFVGPAGQLLRTHLEQAGIDVRAAYVTNAVKHFKFEQRGKRRLHQSPTAGEIDTCRWWLDSERELVRPQLVLALGASAARSLLGKTVSIQRERGRPNKLPDGGELWITAHPSYLLRLRDGGRETETRKFAHDLKQVAVRLASFG